MTDKHLNSMMENLYWWGIPTMFRCPNETAIGKDIALVGVPHSTGNGTTERDQHLGPRALRNVSAVARRMHGEFNHHACVWLLQRPVSYTHRTLPPNKKVEETALRDSTETRKQRNSG